MQPPSASPCRGGISWQGVLLAVSLLTFWNPHPTAQLTIEPVPFDAAEGRDVLLLVHNVSGNTVGVSWYRGQITDRSRLIVSYSNITHSAAQGPAFSGREIVYPNGSLLFVNLTKEDTGFYTLQTTTAIFDTEAATGEIRVHEKLPKPNITINNSQPMEGEDSLALTCEPEISYATYLWKINSQRIPDGDRLKLSNNNRTLTLFSVTRNDTGPYECETQNPVSASRSDPLTLNISCLLVGAVAGIVTGVLVGVLVAALGCFLLHTRTGRYPGFPHLMPPQVTPGLRDGGPSSDSGLTPTSPLPRDPPLSPSLPPSITSCWPWADCSTAASSAHWSPGPVPTALVSLPRLVFNTAPPAVFAPHQERAEAMCMRGPVPGHSGQGLGPGEEGGSTLHTSCVAQGP
uniref:Ig-like domain-containing protein n=1 Tax=Spermophilus dauricus TaxID=99837 RepID=A0A8C9QM37_SPEDA